MLNKLVALTILTAACTVAANAQTRPTASQKQGQRMTFSLPSEGSYLGVQTEDISKENFSKYGLSIVRGIGVAKVVENSPAAKAGLRNGDVIVKFEGEEISSVRKLTRLIGETAPDHVAKLTVLRDGGEREISVTLGERDTTQISGRNFSFGNLQDLTSLSDFQPTPQLAPFPLSADGDANVFILRNGASRQIGVNVMPLTKQLGDYFGAADGKGLLINEVRENSPAAKAGLKAGDVIVEVEGKAVKGMPDLIRAIGEKKEGGVSITFLRDKNRQTISVVPETVKQDDAKPENLEKLFGDAPNRNNN